MSDENDKQEVTVVDIKMPFISIFFMWISQDVIWPITLALPHSVFRTEETIMRFIWAISCCPFAKQPVS